MNDMKKPAFPQWPVKLNLIRPEAPRFRNADLVLVADCALFASPDLHERFLGGRSVAIGCPKFDDLALYREKLTDMLATADPASLRVIYMEVPCCAGLAYIARQVLAAAAKDVPLDTVMLGIDGQVQETASG
ncbi:MAG TPA: iron-sulfur cluster-binding oxidoreductase [Spirochaetia bacterium]|nr:iron-sulfur cluster-binding oxidoreductase [Spirochaetia bacterium]